MSNSWIIVVDGVCGLKSSRSRALRKCVSESPILHGEFMDRVRGTIMSMSTDEYSKQISDFIREKGLRIISEKPVARIKDDRYVVEVYFTIVW
jgi:hypothetical protein